MSFILYFINIYLKWKIVYVLKHQEKLKIEKWKIAKMKNRHGLTS